MPWQNEGFNNRMVHIETILKSGDSMDFESSYLLNQYTAPSPEALCSAMESIMDASINFATITNLNDSPVTMSQTAFDLLAESNIEIGILALTKNLNDKDILTIEKAKDIVKALAKDEYPTIATICNTDESKKGFATLTQNNVNRITYTIMSAAYWVSIMTRPAGEYSDLPPTYQQALHAVGAAIGYKENYYNKDAESKDDTCGQQTSENNGWVEEEIRHKMTPRSKGQWYPLSGNAETIIQLLTDVKFYNSQGFTSQEDRESKYIEAVASAVRNRNNRQAAAEGRALKAQAQAEEQTQKIVANIDF